MDTFFKQKVRVVVCMLVGLMAQGARASDSDGRWVPDGWSTLGSLRWSPNRPPVAPVAPSAAQGARASGSDGRWVPDGWSTLGGPKWAPNRPSVAPVRPTVHGPASLPRTFAYAALGYSKATMSQF